MDLAKANILSNIFMRAGDRVEKLRHGPGTSESGNIFMAINEVRAMVDQVQGARVHIGPLPDLQPRLTLLPLPGGKNKD